jgi:hypothetical protein
MKSKKKSGASKSTKQRVAHEIEGAASGALAGAVMGSIAGPPGVVAGAIIGGAAGAVAGATLDTESTREGAHTRELDATIGVTKGTIGAPNLAHPPAKIGALSAASAGGSSSSGEEPAEGPMQVPED